MGFLAKPLVRDRVRLGRACPHQQRVAGIRRARWASDAEPARVRVLSPSSVRLRRARWRAENLESRLPQYLRELTDRVTILLPGALAEIFPIHQVGVLAALPVKPVHIAFRLAVLDPAPMLHLSQLLDLLRGERELRNARGPRDDDAVDGLELDADVFGLRKVGPLAIGRQFLPGPHRLVEAR